MTTLPQWTVETGGVAKRMAGVWTHNEVERRLREAMTFARAAYRDDDFVSGDRILTVAFGGE